MRRTLASATDLGKTSTVGPDIAHLPPDRRAALARIVDIAREAFAVAVSRGTQPWKRSGEIHRIVLFGPLAASGPSIADGPASGEAACDYTVLIVVSHRNLVTMPKYWRPAEDAIRYDPAIDRPVTMIVQAQDDVDAGIARGDAFWTGIARAGIALYERPGAAPVVPAAMPLPAPSLDDGGDNAGMADLAAQSAQTPDDLLRSWAARIDDAIRVARFCQETDNRRDAAFMLHQAAERAYFCHLLVRGQYAPRTHNLTFLRSLAEASEPRLVPSWARVAKADRRRFDLVKRAYVDARYTPDYAIEIEDLDAIAASVQGLRDTVTALCRAWLDERRRAERGEALRR
jgi:HEPN domain-containing protein